MTKLILFDIDGILLKGKNEAHRESFSVAIKKIFGLDVKLDEIDSQGKTDTRILIELLDKRGIQTADVRPKLKEMYEIMTEFVRENIKNSNLIVVPNVEDLLGRLKNKGHILGLLTGNLEEIAKLKLQRMKLFEFFQVGGFGEISEIREKLVEEAIKQAENKFYTNINKKDVFYIGDTPRDIECGKNAGVKTIAVATGSYTKEELMKHTPDYLFESFSDLESIIKIFDSS